MIHTIEKENKRKARHKRIRRKVAGSPEQPRLSIHRSHKNLFVQVIDDSQGKVLFGMSTLSKEIKSKLKYGGNKKAASLFGETFAGLAQKKGIKKVCFDRGGYQYHGRIKEFAEAARKSGLEF